MGVYYYFEGSSSIIEDRSSLSSSTFINNLDGLLKGEGANATSSDYFTSGSTTLFISY